MKAHALRAMLLVTTCLALAGAPFMVALGGSGLEMGQAVLETSDGGFLVAGNTTSYGAGNTDVLLAKFDEYGYEQWSRAAGGVDDDYAWDALETAGGDFLIAGSTHSFGGA